MLSLSLRRGNVALFTMLLGTFLTLQSTVVQGAERRSARGASCVNCRRPTPVNRVRSAPCHPKGYVDPAIARNYRTAMRDIRRAGITPRVTSTWRSSQDQARLYRCTRNARCRRANPGLYRAKPPGSSAHEAGLAVDLSGVAAGPRGAKHLTPKGRRIVQIMRKHGFSWRYGLADPAHFEANARRHGYRSLNQAIRLNQSRCQVKLARANGQTQKPGNRAQARRDIQVVARRRAEAAGGR